MRVSADPPGRQAAGDSLVAATPADFGVIPSQMVPWRADGGIGSNKCDEIIVAEFRLERPLA